MWLRSVLPERQLDADSRATVKLGIGLIATMTAVVLGLVTASAKSSFDAVDTGVKQTATQVLALDRVLARYGSETGEIRKGLQRTVGARIDTIWPQGSAKPASLDPMSSETVFEAERLAAAIRDLKPHNDSSGRSSPVRWTFWKHCCKAGGFSSPAPERQFLRCSLRSSCSGSRSHSRASAYLLRGTPWL